MKMKKIISMMICFSLLLFAVKVDINAEEKVSINVGNTDVLSTSMEGIKYENGKLYLDNFTSSERLVIKGIDRLEIVVTGENRIESDSRVPFSAINTHVTFSGGGKLSITNKTQSGVPALYYGNESGCGACAIGMTVKDNTSVFVETNVKDGTAVLIGFNSDASKKDRGFLVKDGGRLIARAKEGIAIDADKINIDNGYVYAKGKKAGLYGGTITVENNGIVEAQARDYAIYSARMSVLSGSDVTTKADFYGTYIHNGDIIVSGGKLTGILTGNYEYANSSNYTLAICSLNDIDVNNGGMIIGKSEKKYSDCGVYAGRYIKQSSSSTIVAGENCRIATTPLEIDFYEDLSSGESITVTEILI